MTLPQTCICYGGPLVGETFGEHSAQCVEDEAARLLATLDTKDRELTTLREQLRVARETLDGASARLWPVANAAPLDVFTRWLGPLGATLQDIDAARETLSRIEKIQEEL